MPAYRLYPSLLSANLARLAEEAHAALEAGADGLHVDVMDNHYVPNLTFGPWICEALRKEGVNAFLDVHLMVQPVDDLIHRFAKAGANAISFHPEASEKVLQHLQFLKVHGIKAGLALNPETSLEVLDPVLEHLDFVLIMSVNPGFSGQGFIPSTYQKLDDLQEKLQKARCAVEIAVDGGVSTQNIRQLADKGVQTFVAGSAIFNEKGCKENILALRQKLS